MQINKTVNQRGQTLIETLVAAFILTMGVSAALGLATYSLNATSNIKQRIVAIGLAREGIEAVKNMRDTNWLNDTLSSDCYNYQNGFIGQLNAKCYKDWLNPGKANSYDLSVSSPTTYVLGFDSTSAKSYWQLIPTSNFGLNLSKKDLTKGLYQADGNISVKNGSSGLGRAIVITPDSSLAPFDQPTVGPRLKVSSVVWWTDKNCPVSDTIPTVDSCKITLETYLTNWKTF